MSRLMDPPPLEDRLTAAASAAASAAAAASSASASAAAAAAAASAAAAAGADGGGGGGKTAEDEKSLGSVADPVVVRLFGILEQANSGGLECPICFDVSDDPLITPCQHAFCRACILDFLNRTDEKNRNCPQVCCCPVTGSYYCDAFLLCCADGARCGWCGVVP
jgi:hypothetical protein